MIGGGAVGGERIHGSPLSIYIAERSLAAQLLAISFIHAHISSVKPFYASSIQKGRQLSLCAPFKDLTPPFFRLVFVLPASRLRVARQHRLQQPMLEERHED